MQDGITRKEPPQNPLYLQMAGLQAGAADNRFLITRKIPAPAFPNRFSLINPHLATRLPYLELAALTGFANQIRELTPDSLRFSEQHACSRIASLLYLLVLASDFSKRYVPVSEFPLTTQLFYNF